MKYLWVCMLGKHSDERTVSFSELHRRSCHPFFIFIYVLRQHHEINIMQLKAGWIKDNIYPFQCEVSQHHSCIFHLLTLLFFLRCFSVVITLHKIKTIVHYKTNILHWDQNISQFVHMLFKKNFYGSSDLTARCSFYTCEMCTTDWPLH